MCVQADEAEATYRTCIADATTQQQELEHTKVTVLRQLQDVIKQSDQTLRSVRTRPFCSKRAFASLPSALTFSSSPPGDHLVLPADAHADGGPAGPLPDPV